MPTLPKKPIVTVDGNLSDWTAAERIDTPANSVAGYDLFGAVQNDTYLIAIESTAATDPVIGAGTTIWLNTDQNAATGYSPFGIIGAEYNITDVNGSFYLYTGAAAQNLVSATPLTAALSPDGKSLEIAVPRALLTPAGGTAPTSINIADWVNNGAKYMPGDYTLPEYTLTDPATLPTPTDTHKVAIVYSDTSAKLYFSQTAYDDLFMAAQNQARMAGVSYDVIDESQLTDIKNLVGYDALIFPAMPDVNTVQLPAIMSTLQSAVYNYHIGIITSGDFLTNDQTGAALPGNPYANMQALLGLTPYTFGTGTTVTVTANDITNPIMQGYTAGQQIQSYSGEGYIAVQGAAGVTPDVLVNQNVTAAGATTPTVLPGVVETTTGGQNVHFATADLLGDSNLLSHAIQSVVLGTQLGVALHISRDAGIVAARMDMDQSSFPADVSPVDANGNPLPPGNGIYDTLIPILQQWNQQYDFVGSFYINIGDNPSPAAGTEGPADTNWTKSLPYYQQILTMGSEIGNHSYTHLINPPITTFTATTVGDTPPGSTTITLSAVPPSFAGVTVGMFVAGTGLGSNTVLPSGAVANTQVTAVSGNQITISYVPGAYGTPNSGTIADIPAGTTLTFTIPQENTNFLQTTGTTLSADGAPFTYDYEFHLSKTVEQQQLGMTIYGAAVPGANETAATDQNLLPYYQSVAPTATTPGYTGYVTGGWTGIGASYPSAFGYLDPTDQNSVYIAPNVTFDFTEIQWEGKTLAQAEADWAAQFQSLTANAAGTPVVVWPFHDYGAAAWNSTTDTSTGSPYSTAMYTNFITQAYNANYEFVTLEELAARIQAQQKATINYTTAGNTITATATPDPAAPDLGGMALDVVNGGTQVIKNVANWYAYSAQEVFLPKNGGSFTVNLGATQDPVTHIASLPMRADLLSCTGDGLNLSFSVVGEGNVIVDLGPYGNTTPVVTGATVKSLSGNQLDLTLTGNFEHDVSITPAAATTGSGSDTLVLSLSEDAYLGDAQFTGSVDGVQLGGTFTATASHAAGASQAFVFKGDWATGMHSVAVNFLNDAYGGTPATDRNLYVNAITYDGTDTGQSATLLTNGPANFLVTDSTAVANPPDVTTGSGPDTLVLKMAEDEYLGDAQFTVSVDGVQLGGTFTTTASHAAGTSQNFIFEGNWAIGTHNVVVTFLNDAWAGTPATDRNLYVNAITYDGTDTGQSAALMSNGPASFVVTDPPPATTGSGSDTLVLSMSEDAYLGDAQFTVSIDGQQLGGTFTAVASHAAGASQTFTFEGDWATGMHNVVVTFLNDAWAGTPATDRNLYVNAITYDGTNTGQSAALMSNGPASFLVTDSTAVANPPAVTTGSGSDTLVLSMAEDEYLGDAQFTVSVDGAQLGGTFTTIASHAAGTSQTFTFKGDWATGMHNVVVNFLNDAWAGTPATDRNLYVNAITYDGTNTGQSATLLGNGPKSFLITDGTAVPNPPTVTTGSGSDTLVLGIAEDEYLGDAQFTVSVDGKQLGGTFATTASHASGASQNFIFKGDWAIGTHNVTVNFLNDAWAGTPATDRNLYVSTITYNGTNTSQSATLLGNGPASFVVTDSTAVPVPPDVTTGSGSDALVLSMAEDEYLGDAQFTVSIDGKQLGGTFTTTASHAAGTSQNFVFRGDFGSGQHTVAVNFLNDAWAGTPATDRNLYVNAIVYNGTNTMQSAALLGQGPKAFAVAGGTTPAVSDTSGTATLQQNLAQAGTYTAGGDTFVLSSGNMVSATLGSGSSTIKFIGASSVALTGGAGSAVVTADAGTNTLVAGAGSLDVTGGGGADAYVFHAGSGLLTIEDFASAKGDTLSVDKTLQGSFSQTSDGKGGTMLGFGTAGHGVDLHGIPALPANSIVWA